MNHPPIGTALIVLLVVVGMTVPAMAHAPTPTSASTAATEGTVAAHSTPGNDTHNDSNVSVSVGQQLATVIAVSSDDVRTEFEDTAFELEVERGDEESRAEAIAERAEELRERAEAIREDYETATEAFEDGELTRSEYAQRLASLNARASNLLSSYEQLSQRATNVSALELRAAGANLSSLDTRLEALRTVTGPGTSALLARYLGESDGTIELKRADGLEIEIERDDGESSREFERPRDDDMNITVAHESALESARAALSSPEAGSWTLVESKVKAHEGAYEFEFALTGSANLTGETEVRVDGSTGEVYRLEEEIERRDDEDDGRDGEREDDEREELTLLVVEGTPAPNATITVRVLAAGEPAAGIPVELDDHELGTTDEHGEIRVTLPSSGEVELTAEHGEAEGDLEFELGDEDDHHAVFQRLNVTADLDGDTIRVEVRFDGEAVRNATVYANDERVGRTDAAGVVTFSIDATGTEDLELEVVKGAFEAELTYAIHDGSLVLTEAEHEGDGDKASRDDDEQADDEDDEDDGDVDEDDSSDDEGSLGLAVVHGEAAPGATVTVEVTADGVPVEEATVTLDGDVVGTTDAHGRIEVTLPMEDSIDLRAEHGDAEGRLEFDFDDDGSEETDDEG